MISVGLPEDPEIIFSNEAMLSAWEKVKSKHSSAGADSISIPEFEHQLQERLSELRSDVLMGRYVPEPYLMYYIKKQSAQGYRPISIISLKDKTVQTAVYQFYRTKFEGMFINTSYAYRIDKSHKKAIGRVLDFILKKNEWVSPIDIDNFFDTIEREKLFYKCSNYFGSELIRKLIEMWVLTGVLYAGEYQSGNLGISQGSVLSPLLSNLYLHSFDAECEKRGITNVRYADNICLCAKSKAELSSNLEFVKEYLHNELGLKLNKQERELFCTHEGFEYLGIFFYGGQRRISSKKIQVLKEKSAQIIRTNSLNMLPEKLNDHTRGVSLYYGSFDTADQLEMLENYLLNIVTDKITTLFQKKEIKHVADIKNHLRRLELYKKRSSKEQNIIVNKIISIAIEKAKSGENPATGVVKTGAQKAVLRKRAIYTVALASQADMLINLAYGSIGKSGEKIVVRKDGKVKSEVLARKLKQVFVAGKGISISTDAIQLCAEQEVTMTFFDSLGNPFAYLSPALSPVSSVSILQTESLSNISGKLLAIQFIAAKIHNQISLIRFFLKNRIISEENKQRYESGLEEMKALMKKIEMTPLSLDFDVLRSKILGYEGNAANSYWKIFASLIPERYEFEKREHRNAGDPVNNLLNYAYGILYSRVLSAVVQAGMNPNISFLHKEQTGKATLTYDVIEPFRAPIGDRAVITLLSKKPKIKIENNRLNDESRRLIMKRVLELLHKEIVYRGKRMAMDEVIIRQAKEIVQFLEKKSKVYRPYLSKW